MERLVEIISKLINVLIGRVTYDNCKDIDLSSTDFTKSDGFYLYVGVAGRVVGISINGDPIDRTFITGYHKIKMKQVTKTNTAATNLAACY